MIEKIVLENCQRFFHVAKWPDAAGCRWQYAGHYGPVSQNDLGRDAVAMIGPWMIEPSKGNPMEILYGVILLDC